MTDKEFQMMNAALPRVRRYGPELTENEQVIVLQGERIEKLESALRKLKSEAGALGAFEPGVRSEIGHTNWECLMLRVREADALLTDTACDPTMQHAPDCPILHGKECLCDPYPITKGDENGHR